jgi:hypothetical protein
VAELRRLEAEAAGSVARVCLWGEKGTLSILQSRLSKLLRDQRMLTAIYKIERVQQVNGQTRFDLYTSAGTSLRNVHWSVLRFLTTSKNEQLYSWRPIATVMLLASRLTVLPCVQKSGYKRSLH